MCFFVNEIHIARLEKTVLFCFWECKWGIITRYKKILFSILKITTLKINELNINLKKTSFYTLYSVLFVYICRN